MSTATFLRTHTFSERLWAASLLPASCVKFVGRYLRPRTRRWYSCCSALPPAGLSCACWYTVAYILNEATLVIPERARRRDWSSTWDAPTTPLTLWSVFTDWGPGPGANRVQHVKIAYWHSKFCMAARHRTWTNSPAFTICTRSWSCPFWRHQPSSCAFCLVVYHQQAIFPVAASYIKTVHARATAAQTFQRNMKTFLFHRSFTY